METLIIVGIIVVIILALTGFFSSRNAEGKIKDGELNPETFIDELIQLRTEKK